MATYSNAMRREGRYIKSLQYIGLCINLFDQCALSSVDDDVRTLVFSTPLASFWYRRFDLSRFERLSDFLLRMRCDLLVECLRFFGVVVFDRIFGEERILTGPVLCMILLTFIFND